MQREAVCETNQAITCSVVLGAAIESEGHDVLCVVCVCVICVCYVLCVSLVQHTFECAFVV